MHLVSGEREIINMEMVDVESQHTKTVHENSSSIFRKASRPVTLTFEDVVYKIKIGKEGFLKRRKKSEEKVILKGITGIVKPGEMLAMLGPSGSGKTTLLTALGGRLGGMLNGSITYNGKPFSNTMKRNTGFVTQDDVLYPHLSVSETLVFTALLRLPNTLLSKEEKILHAEAVITQLGLTNCKDSIIGGPLLRGISGGERKRVSIGQEMLINPSLLFLDEPTSGLDSTTAQRIVSTLWELAKGGRTIVMTIHQPSSRLFYMFHKVLLLSEGNSFYFGKGSEAMDYFANIGYAPSVAMNPADFLLDIANGVSSDDLEEDPSKIKRTLVSAYKSYLAPQLKVAISEVSSDVYQDAREDKQYGRWATNWWQQFTVLLRRGLKERKHEAFSALKIGEILTVALISGLLWWQTDSSHLQDTLGLLFFTCGLWGFLPLFGAIFTFPQERMILEKERASGMYRLSSYFMSRAIGDLPMELVLPALFAVITYWMGGLKPEAASFILYVLVLLYGVLVSQGIGLALGALVMDQKAATTLGSVFMLTFMLAGGYYVQNVPVFIRWTKYLSLMNYTYKLLLGSQFKPTDKYPCAMGRGNDGYCFVGDYPAIKQVGLDGQLLSAFALAVMLVGYRLLAYFSLRRIGVPKN